MIILDHDTRIRLAALEAAATSIEKSHNLVFGKDELLSRAREIEAYIRGATTQGNKGSHSPFAAQGPRQYSPPVGGRNQPINEL